MSVRRSARRATLLALVLVLPTRADAQRRAATRHSGASAADTATVVVARPTVIAYLVVPDGAVDTSADIAVLADDWNVAMATMGDSLTAHGIGFALVTEPRLIVRIAGRGAVVLTLDDEPAAGYVFARPGAAPCVRHGAAELADVLRAARTLARRALTTGERVRANCVSAR
jgi:hypothetical protein